MTAWNKETFIFFLFCGFSFFFHYSSNSHINVSSDVFQGVLSVVNFILHHTFKPIEVFFHEASHGLAAILSGRTLNTLNLAWEGSGYVEHSGSSGLGATITSFAGYFGAAVWGFLIYYSSLNSNKVIKGFLIAFCLMFFYFVDGINTFIILSLILAVFFACWKFNTAGSYLLRFIGIFVMVSAIYSPTYLLSYSDQGDHVSMQGHTFIPSIVWIGIWLSISIFFLYRAFKSSTVLKKTENNLPQENKNIFSK